MIAPQYRSTEPLGRPDPWHPDPQNYRPPQRPEAGNSGLVAAMQETARGVSSKHPVLVLVAAVSVGAVLGCLVKRR